MKKPLLALVVLASVSGVAVAQSSVSVYGIVDASLVKAKDVSLQQQSGNFSGSRLGFKGSEDLGGGLKANFDIQHGFAVDTGKQGKEGSFANRQSWVGLSGGFGDVVIGNTLTAHDDVAGASHSQFDDGFAPENLILTTYNYVGRPGNMIKYTSPTVSGIGFGFSTNLKEGAAKAHTSFQVNYSGGPVFASLSHQRDADETKFTRANFTYDLGAAKILVGLGNQDKSGSKTKDLNIGADIPMGAKTTLSTGYARSKPGSGEAVTGFGVGVNHELSKRTNVYGGLTKTKNGGPDTLLGLGIRHKF
jgi:predicted porin